MNILSLDLSTKSKEKIINIEQLNTYKNYFVVYLLIFPNKKENTSKITKKNKKLKKQLKQIKNSKSWKLTEPLRKLKQLLKK